MTSALLAASRFVKPLPSHHSRFSNEDGLALRAPRANSGDILPERSANQYIKNASKMHPKYIQNLVYMYCVDRQCICLGVYDTPRDGVYVLGR